MAVQIAAPRSNATEPTGSLSADLLPNLFLSLSRGTNDQCKCSSSAGGGGDQSAAGSDPISKRLCPDSMNKGVPKRPTWCAVPCPRTAG